MTVELLDNETEYARCFDTLTELRHLETKIAASTPIMAATLPTLRSLEDLNRNLHRSGAVGEKGFSQIADRLSFHISRLEGYLISAKALQQRSQGTTEMVRSWDTMPLLAGSYVVD